ncbi:RICIN domain-containing protein [Streptomyces sp. NPDC046931]|uniref:RICIN domain-containing protein n=1 Tax=Streptomyces sp. NPDC046931 TaxID=3154806 RepID=UPI0033E080FE
MAGFGALGGSRASRITASHGGVAVGHAGHVTYIRKQRARRMRLLVVPVLVAGGTITAITLVPDSSPPGRGRSSSVPSSSVAPPPSGPPSATGSPSASASASVARVSGSAAAVAQPAQTSAAVTPEAEPPPSGEPAATRLSPGSVSRLRNVSTGQCVSGDGSVYPGYGTCTSSDAYAWTLRSFGGSTFELVNRASGNCLSAPYNNNYAAGLEACGGVGGTGYQHWRMGSPTAAGQTLKNTETGHCLEIASPAYGGGNQVMVATCNSDERRQLWKN